MKAKKVNTSDVNILLFLSAFVFAMLFLVSYDSYTHYPFPRADSAWFFMCGKSWMNGMIPYVDFTDSKGPLLWLIYGIGYLLSHFNYHGVFWVSWVFYIFTYYFVFKTCEIFLEDRAKSLLGSVLMSFIFFLPWIHNEVRAEDFGQLFITFSVYSASLLLFSKDPRPKTRMHFIALGACFGALFLIKYNMAAVQAVFILFSLYAVCDKKRSFKPVIAGAGLLALGFTAICLPFIIFFIATGSLSSFINEYFFNTILTFITPLEAGMPEDTILSSYAYSWNKVFSHPRIVLVIVVELVGAVLFMMKLKKHKSFPIVVSIWIWLTAAMHAKWLYYYNAASVSMLFTVVYLLWSVKVRRPGRWIAPVCAATLVIVSLGNYHKMPQPVLRWMDSPAMEQFDSVSRIISRIENPRILNTYQETGFGIESGALPAGKRWSVQNGGTMQMIEEHCDLIREMKPDFIIFFVDSPIYYYPLTQEDIESIGYVKCFAGNFDDHPRVIFTKHKELLD